MRADHEDYPSLLRLVCAAADSVKPQGRTERFPDYRARVAEAMSRAGAPTMLAPPEPPPPMRQSEKLEAERRRLAKQKRRERDNTPSVSPSRELPEGEPWRIKSSSRDGLRGDPARYANNTFRLFIMCAARSRPKRHLRYHSLRRIP